MSSSAPGSPRLGVDKRSSSPANLPQTELKPEDSDDGETTGRTDRDADDIDGVRPSNRDSAGKRREEAGDDDGQDDDDKEAQEDEGDEDQRPRRSRYEDEDDEDEDEEEEDEDDEDEEDEDDEDDSGKRKKKRRRRGGNRFLDLEVEVDDDEEEMDDEDAAAAQADGFIEEELDEGDEDLRRRATAADNQRLDRRRREQEEASAEEMAARLNERYKRSRMTAASDYSEVPQRMLMPSINDPHLYGVRVKRGREKDVVMTLVRKIIYREMSNKPLAAISAFCRDSIPERIYVEAHNSKDVLEACQDIVGAYARSDNLILVPINEMADLLRITKQREEIKPGGWVRFRRGKHAGDLAQVLDSTDNGEIVGVKYVPRIDLNPRSEFEYTDSTGRKRKKGGAGATVIGERPPARFFNPEELQKVYPREAISRKGNHFFFKGKEYVDGYCEEDVKRTMLITENVGPTLDEITRFAGESAASAGELAVAGKVGGVDLNLLADATRAKAETILRRDDHVEVMEGEQAGAIGIVDTVGPEVVTVKLQIDDSHEQIIEVPVRAVQKRFKPGDHIKVMSGKHADETGLVVKVEDNVTTFLSDLSLSEVSVFNKDIHEAAEVGSGVNTIAGYELHELVQLDNQTAGVIFKIEREVFLVLDQLGQTRQVKPSQIQMKRDSSRAVAMDSEGGEFRAGDSMKEIEGEERDGKVLHVYQSMLVWLFNRDNKENGGVFLARARHLRPKAPRSAVSDLSKQNPALNAAMGNKNASGPAGGAISNMRRPGGRDLLAGKTVAITRGPYKTYRGIIKDTNGPMARVELHTMSKVLTIEIAHLVEKDPITGKSKPLTGPLSRPGAMGPPGMGPPSYGSSGAGAGLSSRTPNPYGSSAAYGGATPAYGAYNSGSKTPAYGAYGSGSKTPAYGGGGYGGDDGGRTPAYGAYGGNDGGRTPAYGAYGGNDGGRTPAYIPDGGRTPAYGGGMATPNPYASSSSRGGPDPRRRGDDAPTPAAGAPTPGPTSLNPRTPGAYGAPTPGVYNAPTPGAYGATPGAYAGAPTPGGGAMSGGGGGYGAPTPGAYGAPTPGAFAAPTPGAGPTPMASAPTPWQGGGGSMVRPRPATSSRPDPLPYILVRLEPRHSTGASYASARFDGKVGSVSEFSENQLRNRTATIRLEDEVGTELEDVPWECLAPVAPTNRGQICLVLQEGEHHRKKAALQSYDGDTALCSIDGQMVFLESSHLALMA